MIDSIIAINFVMQLIYANLCYLINIINAAGNWTQWLTALIESWEILRIRVSYKMAFRVVCFQWHVWWEFVGYHGYTLYTGFYYTLWRKTYKKR